MTALVATMLALVAPQHHPPIAVDPCGHRCHRRVRHRILREHHMRHRVRQRILHRHWRLAVAPYRGWLEATARCESGGRWNIATGNGFYGGLQFTLSSWRAVGGAGYPHTATKLEQMFRGVRLLHLQGRGAWPVCG
jgi:hypothetical protein